MFRLPPPNLYNLKTTNKDKLTITDDFLAKQASLTVSGQLEGELVAMALGEIYTFGPTLAENSNTPRHLSEFWMIEPEMAFYEIADNMQLAEDFVKHCIQWALDNCQDDITFIRNVIKNCRTFEICCDNEFIRLTYTEGSIEILEDAVKNGKNSEFWGTEY